MPKSTGERWMGVPETAQQPGRNVPDALQLHRPEPAPRPQVGRVIYVKRLDRWLEGRPTGGRGAEESRRAYPETWIAWSRPRSRDAQGVRTQDAADERPPPIPSTRDRSLRP